MCPYACQWHRQPCHSAQLLDYSAYSGYQLLFNLDEMSASYRKLLIVLIAMYIAGFAQSANGYAFWAAGSVLFVIFRAVSGAITDVYTVPLLICTVQPASRSRILKCCCTVAP